MAKRVNKEILAEVLETAGYNQGGKVAKSDAAAARNLVNQITKVDKQLAKWHLKKTDSGGYLGVELDVFATDFADALSNALLKWDIQFMLSLDDSYSGPTKSASGTDLFFCIDLSVWWYDPASDKHKKVSEPIDEFMNKRIIPLLRKHADELKAKKMRFDKDKAVREGKEAAAGPLIEVICDSWTLPAKKDVTTPKGVLKCWFVEHGDQGYKKKASIDGKVYSEDPHEGWKAGDDKTSLIEKYWVDPSKKVVKTSEGTLKCWVEEHPEGADRGGYLGKAEIDGKVFTEHPVDGWELG